MVLPNKCIQLLIKSSVAFTFCLQILSFCLFLSSFVTNYAQKR